MKQALRTRAVPAGQRPGRSVEIATRSELKACSSWRQAFAHARKDYRYYEIVEDTIMPHFDYRYFVIRDDRGRICAVQPFFLLEQDLLEGALKIVQSGAEGVRRLWPGFLKMRTLMLGCAAGEAHLARGPENRSSDAALIARDITQHARALGARLIVLKEFPAAYRGDLDVFLDYGFTRIPSLPMAVLDLNYASFEDYMRRALTGRMRSDLRRKFRAAEADRPITVSIVRDVSDVIDDIYPLYLQVYDRSERRFEKLTRDYFCALGRRMPDNVRFFLWRIDGRIVAFSLTMVHDGEIWNEYLGLDYDIALDRHLYFVAFRDVVTWAIANGYERCMTGGLGYAPKLSLGFRLSALDLYVRHSSDFWNMAFGWLLPLIEPTRSEPVLRRFPNYDEVCSGEHRRGA